MPWGPVRSLARRRAASRSGTGRDAARARAPSPGRRAIGHVRRAATGAARAAAAAPAAAPFFAYSAGAPSAARAAFATSMSCV